MLATYKYEAPKQRGKCKTEVARPTTKENIQKHTKYHGTTPRDHPKFGKEHQFSLQERV